MKLALTVLCFTMCGAMAMATFNAFHREDPRNNAFHQDEQESYIDQGTGQDQLTAVVQNSPVARVVVQGSTIALQSVFDKRTWMSCFTPDCKKSGCPKLYMDPHDWNNCWGEVFQIYRQGGTGNILVGDVIGIHYPREHGQWFSMFEGHGHKTPCPGPPNPNTGFANNDKWNQCWGETFRIFARGQDGNVKSVRQPIQEHDIIMLCYSKEHKFVSFGDVFSLQTCPMTSIPPPANKYDECWGEVAELWLRHSGVQHNARVVVQGSTIAVQSVFDKRTWMSCFTPDCKKSGCPKLYMDPNDWNNCWGEVFQIYRQGGNGNILVGDVIGIHYPRERGQWFSMFEGHGHKTPCPGPPNPNTGFANNDKWNQCWGETFRIYARGQDGNVKSLHQPIKEHDIIMLCFYKENKFVSFKDVFDLQTCPGTAYPPPANKYDECWGEVAQLWLR